MDEGEDTPGFIASLARRLNEETAAAEGALACVLMTELEDAWLSLPDFVLLVVEFAVEGRPGLVLEVVVLRAK